MAIIFSYPTLTNLQQEDLLLVSDVSAKDKPTKQITVKQITDLIPALVPGGGTVTSVELSGGSTGITVTATNGNPITTNGTFTLGGVLNQGFGGTGFNSYGAYEMILSDASGALTKLSPGTANQILAMSADTTPVPQWTTITTGGTVTSVNVLGGNTGLAFTGGPILNSGDITAADTSRLKVAYGGTWDGTTAGTWTQQQAIDTLTNASSGTLGQVLAIDASGNATFSTITTGVSSWSGGTTGLQASGTDPGTGAVVLTGTLNASSGGTGITSFSASDDKCLFFYDNSAPTILQKLALGSANQTLTVNAAGNAIEWSSSSSSVSGGGTAGYQTRWIGSSNLGNASILDDGQFIAYGLTAVDTTCAFYIRGKATKGQLTVQSLGDNASHAGSFLAGTEYTGTGEIVALKANMSSTLSSGNAFAITGTSTSAREGLNIAGVFTASNSGAGEAYAVRLVDGSESVGKYLKCVTAQGDGQWATIADTDTTYTIQVPSQGANPYASIDLVSSGLSPVVAVKMAANSASVTNTDLIVDGNDSTDTISYAHKDLFTGTPGTFIGVSDITVNSSGHVTAAVSEKFVGSVIKGIDPGLAGFQTESALQQIAIPMPVNGTGKPGDLKVTIVNNGTNSNVIKCAFYSGNIGEALGGGNRLTTWGTASIGIGTNVGVAIPVDSNYQTAPQDKFSEGNYIMILEIPSTMQLLSISQDGDLTNGGCFVTGTIFGAFPSYTPVQDLTGITKTTRVAGSPIKLPTFEWVSA
tara:strand:+ start:1185 stop:3449 length:2265 start_codon:yes stop_codon:yes gene_type:complete